MSSSSSSDWAAWGAGGATGGGKVATPFINGGWPTGVGAGTGEIAPANSADGAWKRELVQGEGWSWEERKVFGDALARPAVQHMSDIAHNR